MQKRVSVQQLPIAMCGVCCDVLQFQHEQGQLVNLLRVAMEDSLDIGLRQVAAITFKNLVKKEWDPSGAPCKDSRRHIAAYLSMR